MEKTPETPKFPVGTQCYFDFELVKVKETNQGRIYCVEYQEKPGWVTQYDFSSSCFPDMPVIEEISNQFIGVKNAFKDAKLVWYGKNDFNEELAIRWREICKLLLLKKQNLKEFRKKYASWLVLQNKIYKKRFLVEFEKKS